MGFGRAFWAPQHNWDYTVIITPLLTGAPAETNHIRMLLLESGIIEHSAKRYVTASRWEAICKELDAQYGDSLMYPDLPAPWRSGRPLAIGVAPQPVLTVINSGTDDEAEINRLNQSPGSVDFKAKLDRLRQDPERDAFDRKFV